jgi:membrane fusion protein (multidrug efflux system)
MNLLKLIEKQSAFYASLFLILLAFGLVGCAGEEEQNQESTEKQATPVSMATVETRTLEETIQAVGSLRADRTVQVSPEIAGRVESVEFEEGDTVNKGDTLAQLDDDKLRQQYESARHFLEEARASLRNARRTLERNKRLREQDAISDQQFDDSQEAFESAQARMRRLEAQVAEARENLEDAAIRAPFDGSIGSREVDAGNYVQPGTPLTTLYKLDPLEVRFTVAERFAGRVRKKQSVNIHVTAYSDTSFTGEVHFVSPSVREQTRDLLIKARLPNESYQLKPGMFGRVQLITETLTDRPVVPAESLVATQDGYIVFGVENGTARRTPVEIGLRQPGWVEIREGVSPGDSIISSGHLSVSDGSQVRPINESEQAESSGSANS